MKLIPKGTFRRDYRKINQKELRLALAEKLLQMERAKDISYITGLKLLDGFASHYRIKVETEKHSFRIGAVIRGDKIWLIRFLPRKTVYRNFP